MNNFTRALWAGTVFGVGLWHGSVGRAADAPPSGHVRGTLTRVSPSELTVSTSRGPVTLRVGPRTKVVGVVPTTAAEITSGAFIGTANVPGDKSTSTRALEVVVFPESMAGVGEGDYPWDMPRAKYSSMTNGTITAKHAGAMMTNATVTGVNNGVSKTVTLQYKGGFKQVTIPPGTPIVRAVPGARSLLVLGAHVFAVHGTSGAPSPYVVVGEQGIVPPM